MKSPKITKVTGLQKMLIALFVYTNYTILLAFAHIKDFLMRFGCFIDKKGSTRTQKKGMAPLFADWESLYTRRMYSRVKDCWNRPICSAPTNWFQVMEVVSNDYNQTQVLTGKEMTCMNFASYNYLGFAENPPSLEQQVLDSLEKYGTSSSSYRCDFGTTDFHVLLEKKIAKFIGKEDAITTAMGFATNSTLIPALCGKETLILSDSKNHSSIAVGARSSGSKVMVFPHNNIIALEKILKEAIMNGQPSKWRAKPWKKIVIVVEGIYSMEGEFCKLAEIVRLKHKYKCYLYVDEAHSIGSIGSHGKGICDFAGVDPSKDVDVLMGTFTKSFGAVGGYIAASKDVIAHLRKQSWSQFYCAPMSVPCCVQIIGALDILDGSDGTDLGKIKINQIYNNSVYFRTKLIEMGFEVVGDEGSPVVCAMIYYPAKVAAFSRECLERGLGVVVVGSPATSLLGSRCRFCLSAAHTREDLDFALAVIDEVGDITGVKYAKPNNIPI